MFDWLNPWWHLTRVIPVPLEPNFVARRFETETSARVSRRPDGRLVVARRWRYLGGYLRTVATLTPNAPNTEVTVTFSRPVATVRLMVAFAILAITLTLVKSVPLVTPGPVRLWNWSSIGILLPAASTGILFAVNHSSAIADANYLLAEFVVALTQPPKNFWRSLAEQTGRV
jgi:hypothetical protein